jgi:hypothetical protein
MGDPVPADDNSAEIVIERQASLAGSAWSWQVLLDGQKVGMLGNGGSLTFRASPGHHAVVVGPASFMQGNRSEPFQFVADAGGRIQLATQGGMWRPKVWGSGPPSTPSASTDMAGTTDAAGTTVEESRYEVPLGDEDRVIDNSQSASTITRAVRLTREWSRTCTVDVERATTVQGSAGLGIRALDLKAEAERTLSKTYSASLDQRETFEEDVTLTINAHTRCRVIFSWKEIRQKGIVELASGGSRVRIPYEMVVGVTFDQQQIDGPAQ